MKEAFDAADRSNRPNRADRSARSAHSVRADRAEAPILIARNLTRYYPVRLGLWRKGTVHALNDVSFTLERGRTLAVVGESGCGKSTLARQLTMIDTPTRGELLIDGQDVARADRAGRLALRQRIQMVFQNPYGSLNPRKTIAQTLAEPLIVQGRTDQASRAGRIADMLLTVGLRPEFARRYPHMFSGGQRQRIAIARAMIVDPEIVVADEPVSALDLSIQAQILNLLMDLQQRFGTSYVFISHNLSVVEHIADEVLVMYLGGVAEYGDKRLIFARPRHPYTRALIAATPTLAPRAAQAVVAVRGEMPSPLKPPPGCSFQSRCPYAIERCRHEPPALREVDGRQVACHRAEEVDA